MAIHAFGAYYGLAASYVLFTKRPAVGASHAKNSSAYLNDVFAMIGTIFLWVFWPSFNAAIATSGGMGTGALQATFDGLQTSLATGDGIDSSDLAAMLHKHHQQQQQGGVTTETLRMYAALNTVLALCGATLAAFAACCFKSKLDAVLVQVRLVYCHKLHCHLHAWQFVYLVVYPSICIWVLSTEHSRGHSHCVTLLAIQTLTSHAERDAGGGRGGGLFGGDGRWRDCHQRLARRRPRHWRSGRCAKLCCLRCKLAARFCHRRHAWRCSWHRRSCRCATVWLLGLQSCVGVQACAINVTLCGALGIGAAAGAQLSCY